jgi:DNA-binding CsgD family transcriptional regulator
MRSLINKKLYAFARPINDFLDMNFSFPVTVYGKDLELCVCAANSYQLSAHNVSDLRDILGMSMYDLFDLYTGSALMSNDKQILQQKRILFFVEKVIEPNCDYRGFYQQCFSIKTILSDSANNIVGCFGLSCAINNTSLAQFTKILNELNIMPVASALSVITLPFLNNNFKMLTPRERECVYYLVRGKSYKGIANMLNITDRTVQTHMEHIKEKLGCYNRANIVERVFECCS